MAYGNNQNRGSFGSNNARPQQNRTLATGTKTSKIKVAGIYEHQPKDPSKESKLLFKGKTMSEVVIPAGYSVSIFKAGGKSKNGKDLPPFEIVAQPALVRQ